MPGYKWFVQNRKVLHKRAKTGSGGVGFLVKVATTYMDTLLTQIHEYQYNGVMMVCGDFTSCVGQSSDHIAGTDVLPERHIVDFNTNSLADTFLQLLISSEFCILNGRNSTINDFTRIRTTGKSVVDYCLVPLEQLRYFTDFAATRATTLFERSGCLGELDPKKGIPDHSALTWKIKLHLPNMSSEELRSATTHIPLKKYFLNRIPEHFMMSADVVNHIPALSIKLQQEQEAVEAVSKLYNDLVQTIKKEMDSEIPNKLSSRINRSKSHTRSFKPWWNDELSNAWNVV